MSGTNYKHVHLLYDFGTFLKIDDSDYPLYDLSFALEMARPASKGGVLIALLQLHSKQNFSNGFWQAGATAKLSKLYPTW